MRKGPSVVDFVEAKDVDKSLKTTLKTNQLKRYLEALSNLLFTNYLDFIWFVGGEKRMEITPYSGESRNKSDWIMQLMQTYKTETEGGPLKKRNSKWLNDDYVKFIRFAHDRVKRTGHGIVAFITNHSWLDNPTFRGMRAQLMMDFDDIYVLDLHGNSKKKERTPAALKAQGDDKNVFDIEQGVSITFLVKLPNTSQDEPVEAVEDLFELTAPEPGKAKKSKHRQLEGGKVTLKARIHQADLWGSRDYKYDWLEKHSLLETPWQDLQPALPNCCWCHAMRLMRRSTSGAGR